MRRPKIRDFIDECEIPNYTVINLDSLDSVSYQNALNEYIDYLEGRLSNLMIKNDYGFDDTVEKIEERFKQIHHDFTTALIDMVINKKKHICAKWE